MTEHMFVSCHTFCGTMTTPLVREEGYAECHTLTPDKKREMWHEMYVTTLSSRPIHVCEPSPSALSSPPRPAYHHENPSPNSQKGLYISARTCYNLHMTTTPAFTPDRQVRP